MLILVSTWIVSRESVTVDEFVQRILDRAGNVISTGVAHTVFVVMNLHKG